MRDIYEVKHMSPLDATVVGLVLACVILASKSPSTTDEQAEAVVDDFFKTVDDIVGKHKNG